MSDENEIERIQASVRAPRAAAVAGIAFSLILGMVIALIRSAVPASADDAGQWMDSTTKRGQVTLATSMLPVAGIAFLWFIGVMRPPRREGRPLLRHGVPRQRRDLDRLTVRSRLSWRPVMRSTSQVGY